MLYRLDRVHRHRQQVFLPLLQVCLLLLLLSPRLQAVVSKILVPLHKFHHQNLSPPSRSLVLMAQPPYPRSAKYPSKIGLQNPFPPIFELSELLPESLDEPISDTTSFAIEGSTIVPVSKSARPKKQNLDILPWVECFNSCVSVIATFQPHRHAICLRTWHSFYGQPSGSSRGRS